MREYTRIRKIISLFLAAYFAGGLLTLLLPEREIFPVYSWFLFALVPQNETQYAIVLHHVGNQELTPERLFQEADGIIAQPHSVAAFQLMQKFGAAFERKSPDATRLRQQLEGTFLQRATRYELVKINSDPVARWKSGSYEIIRTLQTFTSGEATP